MAMSTPLAEASSEIAAADGPMPNGDNCKGREQAR